MIIAANLRRLTDEDVAGVDASFRVHFSELVMPSELLRTGPERLPSNIWGCQWG